MPPPNRRRDDAVRRHGAFELPRARTPNTRPPGGGACGGRTPHAPFRRTHPATTARRGRTLVPAHRPNPTARAMTSEANSHRPAPTELVLLDVGGPIYDDAVYRDALLRATRELAETEIDRVAFQRVYDEQRQRQAGSLRTAVAEHFLTPGDRRRLSDLAESYWEYPPSALYPEVLPTLRTLAGTYRLAVVANQRELVVEALRRDGIAEHVDVWAISETVGAEKPDPAIFRYAMDRAGIPAERAVHVGNRLDTDVRGAKRVGLRSVWITRGEAPPEPTEAQLTEPDAVIRSLDELPAALERLGRTAS
nr:HAD family hydrolase [Actinopolyspora erythraea]